MAISADVLNQVLRELRLLQVKDLESSFLARFPPVGVADVAIPAGEVGMVRVPAVTDGLLDFDDAMLSRQRERTLIERPAAAVRIISGDELIRGQLPIFFGVDPAMPDPSPAKAPEPTPVDEPRRVRRIIPLATARGGS